MPAKVPTLNKFPQTAFVFQGGGALGAYQAGVYQALSEAGYEPDWLAGISIGAINSAIIAGNAPSQRLPKLQEFWDQVTSSFRWPALDFGDHFRQMFNSASATNSIISGQAGFFTPRVIPAVMQPYGSAGALSVYDTAPLRATLEKLVDFDRINAGKTRLSLGAVNIRNGNFVYFDNQTNKITPDHIMASAALPPGFPPIEIDGEYYWDGGLVSNTPLVQVLDDKLHKDTLVFQVDLFDARGDLPGNLLEVEERRKHIAYSSRTRLNTDIFTEKHKLRRAIIDLLKILPPDTKKSENIKKLCIESALHNVAIVHLIYRRANYEGQAIDYEFSRASMTEHWKAGHNDGHNTLKHPRWNEPWDNESGVMVFDLTQDVPGKHTIHNR